MIVRLFPNASINKNMAAVFSCVRMGEPCFLEDLDPEDIDTIKDMVCFKLLVFPEPISKVK
jgi:hypothetical protein